MKIWIYQSERPFTASEKQDIITDLKEYTSRWSAHGKKLAAEFELPYDHFIVLKVDEALEDASGCSIDDSVRFIQSLEKKYNLSLLNRQNMAYLAGEEVRVVPLEDLSALFSKGAIARDTLVFNNLVKGEQEYPSAWKMPLKDTGYIAFCY